MSKYSKSLLENLVVSSTSMTEVLIKLNLKPSGGNFDNIKKRLCEYGIDFSHFSKEKHTKERLEPLVRQSVSLSGVLRLLGLRPGGGTQAFISRKITQHGIDTSHFLGQKTNSGPRYKGLRKRHWKEILICKINGNRENGYILRNALIQSGRICRCEGDNCTVIDKWNGEELKLHIHHCDGDWLNNTVDNLKFLCPNCHSQTKNYCRKNRR